MVCLLVKTCPIVGSPILMRVSILHRIVDNLPGATSFRTFDKQKKYYAAGFKLGNFDDENTYIHNHVTLIIRYRKSSKNPEKKLIVAFEVYPKSYVSFSRYGYFRSKS